MSETCACTVLRGHKRALNSMGLELEMVVGARN